MTKTRSLILFDLIWALIWLWVTVPALLVVALFHRTAAALLPPWLSLGLLPLDYILLCVSLCLVVWPLRALFAQLTPGEYAFPGPAESRRWMIGFALQRILYFPLWQPFIFTFATLRFLCLRALGAQVPLQMQTASDALILDAGLHQLGEGCMLGTGVMLSGHMIQDGRLRLGRIVLGREVQVRAGVAIGPNVEIGDFSVIGLDSRLGLGVRTCIWACAVCWGKGSLSRTMSSSGIT